MLKERINNKTFIVIISLLVGISSGLAAIILKKVVHFFQQEPKILFNDKGLDFLLPFLPLVGIIFSVLIVNLFFNGTISKGISNIIYLILRKNADVPRRKILSHLLTSGVTVGMGGSAGLEAPIVIIGASIGSNAAKDLKLDHQTRTLLLACGSAAGISAIFNSPIAGVIFAFEVILPEITVPAFIPLLIASASAAVLSKFLYGGQIFYLVTEGWYFYALPYYIILGLLCGLVSLYMIKTSIKLESMLEHYKHKFYKAIIGGLILCSLIFLLPPIYGEGYDTIIKLLGNRQNELFNGSFFYSISGSDFSLIIFLILVILAKVMATSLTIGSGGNGGIIAPSLFTGAVTGSLIIQLTKYFNVAQLSSPNFIVVGMGGVLSGVLHAPLTGIFLIAEITGGYVLIVPLMIVTAISYFVSRFFHPNSIYTTSLAKMGIKFRSEKEKYFVQHISIIDLVETDFDIVNPSITLRELVTIITHTKRNIFPVVDKDNMLIGIVTLDDVREMLLDDKSYDIVIVSDIMNTGIGSIDIKMDINNAIEIFEKKNIWNLPVTDNGKYIGLISKSNIFNRYITVWAKQQENEI